MTSLWKNAGGIIAGVAGLSRCAECPCTFPTTPDCVSCSGDAADEWLLNVSGIADNLCDACDQLNGTFILRHVSACIWESDEKSAVCSPCTPGASAAIRWRLIVLSGNFRLSGRITVSPSCSSALETAVYLKSGVDFDCLASNVMTRSGTGNAQCSGYPATLTITPN